VVSATTLNDRRIRDRGLEMKFEAWRLDPLIVDVINGSDRRIGTIHNPHSELSSFFPCVDSGEELELKELQEIVAHMEPITAVHAEGGESDV